MRLKLFVIFAVLLSTFWISFPSAAQHKGEKSVGLRAGFTTRNSTATAGLYFSYRFSEHFRLAPKIDYAFPHHLTDAFSFDIDAEMPISLSAADNVNFYPIGGLNYSTYTIHRSTPNIDPDDDSAQRNNELGLSVGAGIEYFPTRSLRLAFESKGVLIRKFSGGWFNVSIGYRF